MENLFANAFWETTGDFAGFPGFDALAQKTMAAREGMGELGEYYRQRAAIQEQYGKQLVKLSKGRCVNRNSLYGGLGEVWDAILVETENTGTAMIQHAQEMVRSVEQLLRTFGERQKETQKKAIESVRPVQRKLAASAERAAKLKEKYESKCRESDAVQDQLAMEKQRSVMGEKDLEKLSAKVERAVQSVHRRDDKYRNAIGELQMDHQTWVSATREAANIFQCLEMERGLYLQLVLREAQQEQAKMVGTVLEHIQGTQSRLDQWQPKRDVVEFVEVNGGTVCEPVPPATYDNYYGPRRARSASGTAPPGGVRRRASVSDATATTILFSPGSYHRRLDGSGLLAVQYESEVHGSLNSLTSASSGGTNTPSSLLSPAAPRRHHIISPLACVDTSSPVSSHRSAPTTPRSHSLQAPRSAFFPSTTQIHAPSSLVSTVTSLHINTTTTTNASGSPPTRKLPLTPTDRGRQQSATNVAANRDSIVQLTTRASPTRLLSPSEEDETKSITHTVRVAHEYRAQGQQELTLHVGDCIVVLEKSNDVWWKGSCRGAVGMFPVSFVEDLAGNRLGMSPEMNRAAKRFQRVKGVLQQRRQQQRSSRATEKEDEAKEEEEEEEEDVVEVETTLRVRSKPIGVRPNSFAASMPHMVIDEEDTLSLSDDDDDEEVEIGQTPADGGELEVGKKTEEGTDEEGKKICEGGGVRTELHKRMVGRRFSAPSASMEEGIAMLRQRKQLPSPGTSMTLLIGTEPDGSEPNDTVEEQSGEVEGLQASGLYAPPSLILEKEEEEEEKEEMEEEEENGADVVE